MKQEIASHTPAREPFTSRGHGNMGLVLALRSDRQRAFGKVENEQLDFGDYHLFLLSY